MKVFVPVTDEMLEQEEIGDLLVPYQPGRLLLSQCREQPVVNQSILKTSLSPVASPSSEDFPALSSSTYLAGPALG